MSHISRTLTTEPAKHYHADGLLHDPLSLPVQSIQLSCRTQRRPLRFLMPSERGFKRGSTPGKTLNNAFEQQLSITACSKYRSGFKSCNPHFRYRDKQFCQLAESCPLLTLHRPYSHTTGEIMARPVYLHVPEFWTYQPIWQFTLRIVFWGHQSIAAYDIILQTLSAMGDCGLDNANGRTPFLIEEIQIDHAKNLAARADEWSITKPQTATLEFVTPFCYREKVKMPSGKEQKLFLAGGELPLAKLLGNLAKQVTLWSLEDQSSHLNRTERHRLAGQTKQAVIAASEPIKVYSDLHPANYGHQRSTLNDQYYPSEGFVGKAVLQGSLTPILPWLLALHLGGGGQHRSKGFGVVDIYFDS